MRCLIAIAFLLSGLLSQAQIDSLGLKEAAQRLDKALLAKDTADLALLLDKKLSFGHSNGWTQTKNDVRDDFASGRLVYNKIETSGLKIAAIDKDWATLTMNVFAEGVGNGKPFSLNLKVMQVWKKDKKGWQLLARQSAKQ